MTTAPQPNPQEPDYRAIARPYQKVGFSNQMLEEHVAFMKWLRANPAALAMLVAGTKYDKQHHQQIRSNIEAYNVSMELHLGALSDAYDKLLKEDAALRERVKALEDKNKRLLSFYSSTTKYIRNLQNTKAFNPCVIEGYSDLESLLSDGGDKEGK